MAARISKARAATLNRVATQRNRSANPLNTSSPPTDLRNASGDIRNSKLSVPEYYAQQVQKILDQGIAIQGSFMFGLPFDRFDSLEDNTGTEVAKFCLDNHISLMPGCFCASPGAKDFERSLQAGTFLYGKPGTMEYLLSLCVADHSEMNIQPPESLRKSPLLVTIMAIESLRRVAMKRQSLKSAAYNGLKAFTNPTARGRQSYQIRAVDGLAAVSSSSRDPASAGGIPQGCLNSTSAPASPPPAKSARPPEDYLMAPPIWGRMKVDPSFILISKALHSFSIKHRSASYLIDAK